MGEGLLDALETLRRHLGRDLFPLDLGDVAAARHAQRELAGQLDDYLIPRLRAIDAPLLAVVGGSTGAGKSTLVNSLLQTEVCESGVLRPTTLAPTLVANPDDMAWFTGQRVLPGLPRTTGAGRAEPGTLRVVEQTAVPRGLALLDAPDIDSVVRANRELAAQLLAAADLWLFVTTAARYADEVPWGFLRAARDRATAVALILDRAPPEALDAIAADLDRLLKANGLEGTPLFSVPEVAGAPVILPAPAVQPIKRWLDGLAADAEQRAAVVRRTLEGALHSLTTRVPRLADAADEQLAAAEALRRDVGSAYDVAMAGFDDGVRDGSLLRGEVLARWQDFIGTGEFMRSLESRIGALRDRIVAAFTGRPRPEAELRVALESGVESLIRSAADQAAERAVEAWSGQPAGRGLLGGPQAGPLTGARLGRASADLPKRAEAAVRDWQGYVLELIRQEGAGKRTTARIASFGVNGAGLLLMLIVFANTGGLTGVEVGIAGGTSVVSQKLLEAIFGDQAVRQLAAKALEDLRGRVRAVLDEDAARFGLLLDGLGLDPAAPAALRESAATVEGARWP